jgi:hypothetical protein
MKWKCEHRADCECENKGPDWLDLNDEFAYHERQPDVGITVSPNTREDPMAKMTFFFKST